MQFRVPTRLIGGIDEKNEGFQTIQHLCDLDHRVLRYCSINVFNGLKEIGPQEQCNSALQTV